MSSVKLGWGRCRVQLQQRERLSSAESQLNKSQLSSNFGQPYRDHYFCYLGNRVTIIMCSIWSGQAFSASGVAERARAVLNFCTSACLQFCMSAYVCISSCLHACISASACLHACNSACLCPRVFSVLPWVRLLLHNLVL